ncbi:MAG: hypothetical protein HZB41_02145 [Ignavibacteriae bacterium]|nr:hypothetical protein [Ignavibacteriota bacterium]
MLKIHGGWNDLQRSMPLNISNIIESATIGATTASIQASSNFNTATGTWVTSPITLNAVPTAIAINATTNPDQAAKVTAMNAQTLMANLNAPPPLKNLVFLYGNQEGSLKYEMDIPLNLGGSTYNSIQISLLDNTATKGDEHGEIQVFDFGSGSWTGVNTLKLVFNGIIGEYLIGIRINDTSNNTSIYNLRTFILPSDSSKLFTDIDYLTQFNNENFNLDKKSKDTIQKSIKAAVHGAAGSVGGRISLEVTDSGYFERIWWMFKEMFR